MISTLTYPQLQATVNAPDEVVRNILNALNKTDIADATSHFSHRFTFVDHALDLTFTEKEGLDGFFQKATQVL